MRQYLLKFGQGNHKLAPWITTFSLPAGYACPFARACHSRADPATGRISDSPGIEFRCYKASEEARYRSSRESGWHNFRLLHSCRTTDKMAELILDSLLPGTPVVRVHTGGDFFSENYFCAWLQFARNRPRTRLYFYTKSIRFWLKHLEDVGNGRRPGRVKNFVPTASWGGQDDRLISDFGLRSARVVLSVEDAEARGLEIDDDDSHAMKHGHDFSLLIHGTQPTGTDAAKALSALRLVQR